MFWSESVWLPSGYTWKDLESTEAVKKANVHDLYTIPLWVAFVLATRYLFERYLATPFCGLLGIKVVFKDAPSNDKPKDEMNNATIFRSRKDHSARQLLKKATETCWRFVFYTVMWSVGLYVILSNEWGTDYSAWMENFIELHEFTWDMKLYYHIELSFYLSLLISQFYDVKRKDFYPMFIHHVTTILLLFASYSNSLYRFGVVIMFLHDCADVFMEAAKVAKYGKLQKVCDVLFAVFAVVFFATRILYYPTYVAYAYFHYNTYDHGYLTKCLVCLCYLLLFLHLYWGYLIAAMAYRLIIVGKVEKDSRSGSDDSEGCD